MTTRAQKELALGVLFQGRMDPTFEEALKRIRQALGNLANAGGTLASSQGKVQKALKKTKDEMSNVHKQIAQVHGGLQRLLAAFKVVVAYGVSGSLIFGLVNSFKSGVSAVIEFDQAMHKLQAITEATRSELLALGSEIYKVARTSGVSVKEISDALVLLGQAGFTATESLDAINGVVRLSTGTLEDMGLTVDLVTTIIKAFNMQASQTDMVADIMANAINKSKLSVDMLRVAFNYVAPVAYKAGWSLRETTTAAALLSNAGIRASTIGTGLRNVINTLQAPTERIREAFIAAGADMSLFASKTVTIRDWIVELTKAIPDAAKALELFGLRGAPIVSVLTTAGVRGFDDMYESMGRAGSAAEMAEVQIKGLQLAIANLKNRFTLLAITIGEAGMVGVVKVLVNWMGKLADVMEKGFGSIIGKVTLNIVTMTTAIIGLTIAMRSLLIAIGSLMAGIKVAILLRYIRRYGEWAAVIRVLMGVWQKWKILIVGSHPVLRLLVLAISAATVAFMTWKKWVGATTDELKKQRLEIDRHIIKLEDYKRQLDDLTPGTEEYRSVLVAMTGDYKELADSVDVLTGRMKDFGKGLDDLIKSKRAMSMGKIIELLWDAKRRERELSEKIATSGGKGAKDEVQKYLLEMERITKETSGWVDSLAQGLFIAGFKGTESLDQILKKIEEIQGGQFFDVDFVKGMAIEVQASLQAIGLQAEVTKKRIEGFALGTKTFLDRITEGMDIKGTMEMTEASKAARTRRAQMEKEWEEGIKEGKEGVEKFEKMQQSIAMGEVELYLAGVEAGIKDIANAKKVYEEKLKFLVKYVGEAKKQRDELINIEEQGRERDIHSAEAELRWDIVFFKKEEELTKDEHERKIRLTEEFNKIKERREEAGAKRIQEINQRYDAQVAAAKEEGRRIDLERTKEFGIKKASLTVAMAKFEARIEKDKIEKIKKRRDADIEELKKRTKDVLAVIVSESERLRIIERAKEQEKIIIGNAAVAIEEEELKHSLKLIEIKKDEQKILLEQLKRGIIERGGTEDELKRQEIEIEMETQQEIVDLYRKFYNVAREKLGENNKLTLRIKEEYLEELFRLEKEFVEKAKFILDEQLEEERKDWEKMLDRRLREMEEEGATELEMWQVKFDTMKKYSDDFWQGIKDGFKDYVIHAKKSYERAADFAIYSIERIEEGISELLIEASKGKFKEWGEYVTAIFQDILSEYIRMIVKMKIMAPLLNTPFLKGLLGLGAPTGTASAAAHEYTQGLFPGLTEMGFQKGGWVKEPMVGRGLWSNRLYTVAEKEPELITPKSKLPATTNNNALSIAVPVNIIQENPRLTTKLRMGIEEAVKRVLKEEMQYG